MKTRFKIALFAGAVLPLLLASCQPAAPGVPSYQGSEAASMPNKVVNENENLSLYWNDDEKAVCLKDKKNGKIWSTTPYDYLQREEKEGVAKVNLMSSLIVDYIEPTAKQLKDAFSSIDAEIVAQQDGKELRVTYYFDGLAFSVPIIYKLGAESLIVRVDVKGITEGENKIYRLSVAPFMCSVQNNAENSYLFFPSGSGSLMYVDTGKRDPRMITDEVYGADPAIIEEQKLKNVEDIKLPVFGVKDSDAALLAVAEDGAASALIGAQAGDEKMEYSSANVIFKVRGLDTVEVPFFNQVSYVNRITDDMVDTGSMSVRFFPLSGQEASYSGMAKKYNAYLGDRYGLGAAKSDVPNRLAIEIFGGANLKKFMFGVPYDSMNALTTFEQAGDMIKEVEASTGVKPAVLLTGFGPSGMDTSKIAGSYKFSSKLGGEKGFKQVLGYCTDQQISLFTDFELVNFSQSGSGFSTLFDAAKTPKNVTAVQRYFSVATLTYRTDLGKYYLLSREKLSKAGEKLLAKYKKYGSMGLSFSTISAVAYSDYQSPQYYAKNNIDKDVGALIQKAKEAGFTYLAYAPNEYAAVYADYLSGTPTNSSLYNGLDADIPFYQMAFSGTVPMSSPAVNASSDPQLRLLKAVESGIALSFCFSGAQTEKFYNSPHTALMSSVYADNKAIMAEMTRKTESYYNAIAGSKIISHQLLTNEVRETVYENGVTVYVNYGSAPQQTPAGEVSGLGFIFK